MRFFNIDDEELEEQVSHEEEEEEEEEGDVRNSDADTDILEDEDAPVDDYSDFVESDDEDTEEQVYDEPPSKHAEVDDY